MNASFLIFGPIAISNQVCRSGAITLLIINSLQHSMIMSHISELLHFNSGNNVINFGAGD